MVSWSTTSDAIFAAGENAHRLPTDYDLCMYCSAGVPCSPDSVPGPGWARMCSIHERAVEVPGNVYRAVSAATPNPKGPTCERDRPTGICCAVDPDLYFFARATLRAIAMVGAFENIWLWTSASGGTRWRPRTCLHPSQLERSPNAPEA